MDAIVEQAKKLADLLANDPRFLRLRDVEARVLADPKLKQLMDEFEKARLTTAHKERNIQPISPDEKRSLQSLRERVIAESLLRDLNRSQADYSEMMELVNRTIHERLQAGHAGADG